MEEYMSKIEVINRALLKLGEAPVSSLNSVAYSASYDAVYEDMKKLLLSSYPWRFAVGIKELALVDELYNGKFMYKLPVDCLLILNVLGTSDVCDINHAEFISEKYEISGDCIITDVKTGIKLEYVKQIDDVGYFTPLFREALAVKIASELAMRVKHSLQLKQMFDNEFLITIKQAEQNNEIMKDTEKLADNSWVLIRNAW